MSGRIWLIAGLAVMAGIGTGIMVMYAVTRVTCRTLTLELLRADDAADDDDRDDDDDDAAGDPAAEENPGDTAAYRAALAQVTAYARDHETFRQDWEAAVRQASDAMTAVITGRWMAGEMHGQVAWGASYPALPAVSHAVLEAAFQLAVHGEVTRRLKAMDGPGAFG